MLKKLFVFVVIIFLFSTFSSAQDISRGRLNVEEEDGSPSTFPYKLKVTNATLTDNGDGTASLSISGGSGDITAVGDVATGAAFDGTAGTTLTFNNAGGDGTIDYDGTDFSISHPVTVTGLLNTSVGIDGVGAVDLDYGSVDITDHTFITDGTGNSEIVLPNDSIGDAEIDWGTGANQVNPADFVNQDIGDITITGGDWAVEDDSHAHTTTTISGIDISADTNLAGTASEIVLTDDTLSLHSAITRDTEWDTIAEINTASTDADILIFQNIAVSGQTTVATDAVADTLTLAGGGINTITTDATTDTITITATEVDGSTTNEIQDLFKTIAVSGQSDVVADTSTDTLTLAGGGITSITTNATTDTVTITATEAQNLFQTISCTSGTNPVADSTTDTLTLTAGSGITITGDNTTDTVTIASTVTSGAPTDATYLTGTADGTLSAEQVADQFTLIATGGTSKIADRLELNNLLSFIKTAEHAVSAYHEIINGWVDIFSDETGVDTATSTNETYDATNDLYSPAGANLRSNADIDNEDMADITDWTDSDSGTGASTQVTFDSKSCMKLDSGGTIGGEANRNQDIGSYGTRTVFSINLYCDAVGTRASGDVIQFQTNDSATYLTVQFASDGLFIYDGAAWNEVGTNLVSTGVWQEWTFDTDWVTSGGQTDVYLGGTLQVSNADSSYTLAGTEGLVSFIQKSNTTANRISYIDWFMAGSDTTFTSYNNMTLVSNAYTAVTANPDTALILVQEEDVDTITINTDLTAEFSEDGGTTWTAITLTDYGDVSGEQIWAGSGDVSAQAGSSVKWRIKTLNNKNCKVHAVAGTYQ